MIILSSGIVATDDAIIKLIICISYIVFAIWVSYLNRKIRILSIISMVFVGILVSSLLFSVVTGKIHGYKYQIKAKFTEQVDIYKLMDNYEIISRDGSIFTLQPTNQSGYKNK